MLIVIGAESWDGGTPHYLANMQGSLEAQTPTDERFMSAQKPSVIAAEKSRHLQITIL